MSLFVPARHSGTEWMDRADNDPREVEAALDDIRVVNRVLGGARALLRAVDRFVRTSAPGAAIDVLDVGTGGGDLPRAMVRLGLRHGRQVRVVAIDREPVAAGVAARSTAGTPGGVLVVRADAFRLPFRPDSFDLVTASMFLHHFTRSEAVRLLWGFRSVARRAVIVNDLRRHRVPWAFIALAARATLRSPMFTHDAAVSVLRGFTPGELLEIGREAGGVASLERVWPYRLVLTLRGDA